MKFLADTGSPAKISRGVGGVRYDRHLRMLLSTRKDRQKSRSRQVRKNSVRRQEKRLAKVNSFLEKKQGTHWKTVREIVGNSKISRCRNTKCTFWKKALLDQSSLERFQDCEAAFWSILRRHVCGDIRFLRRFLQNMFQIQGTQGNSRVRTEEKFRRFLQKSRKHSSEDRSRSGIGFVKIFRKNRHMNMKSF